MNFSELITVVFNNDSGMKFLQKDNAIKDRDGGVRKRINNWPTSSRQPIHAIVHFICYWAREMSSVTFCKRELKIGQNDVVDWSNYLRENLCGDHVEQDAFKTILKDISEFWSPL
ncbi:Hypothetical protein CINCED_3A015258 [Cinara cedri]|uniref:Uncharacterized protein n=1 Tax=Cinara cedri TaxID=506608 RepID=A0A5E4NHE9_9HEMI|nr:Hypothetical protein CINCED_3A015258 [Cinara cedri]